MEIDNWQKGYAELRRELAKLKQENLATKDELTKLRRTYEDQINNLTFDNMPTVKKITLQSEDGVVGLTIKLNETNAQVLTIAEVQTEQGKTIALIDEKADGAVSQINLAVQRSEAAEKTANEASANTILVANDLGARIEQVAKTQTEQGESIASLTQKTNEQSAEISLAVERVGYAEEAANEANANVSNGAYLVARVNEDGSEVKIKADKLELSGYATFSSLSEPGKTEIDGANLKTGTVVADRIALNANGQIDFSNLGTLYFLTPAGASGEIRLNENEDGRGEISIFADMYASIAGGNAQLSLSEGADMRTEVRVYADSLVMNGDKGLSGTFHIGGGSITVANGIVVGVTEGEDEPTTLLDPEVIADEEYYGFRISNPNDVGTIHYYLFYHDNSTGYWRSDTESAEGSVAGYLEVPASGGVAGVTAWVEYNGIESNTVTATISYA